ncbi:MAG: thioredoxin domain-containing protein, partial [Planctomycetota bacterium]
MPHFEKMLYDNGQLASTYAAAYERTGDVWYAEIVRETLDYVLREMTDPAGGFFSAQDAEVNTREGGNYIWVADEVRAVLADADMSDDIDVALDVYGFSQGTNFQDPHHPEDAPTNVVYLRDRPERLAEQHALT